MKNLFTFWVLIFLISLSYAQTPVTNNISTHTTWNVSGSPYIISSTIQIDSGITLTIDPAVEVQFQGVGILMVIGKLVANGTMTDSVRFVGKGSTTFGNSPTINYLGEVQLNYTIIDSMKNGLYVNNAVINNNQHLARLDIKNTRFTHLSGIGIQTWHNDSSWVNIDSCLFFDCGGGVGGTYCTISNSKFISNREGVSGSDFVITNTEFKDNENRGARLFLPFEVRDCRFENHMTAALLALQTFGTPNQMSYFENNTLVNNKIGLHVYRDSGMIAPNRLFIQQNEICSDSINLFYDIISSSATTIFPILDLQQNCWCEWTPSAVWPTFSNPFNKLVNIFPIDSTCLPSLVFPGDANHDQIVDNFDLLPIGLHYGQTGPVRPGASTNWIGQRVDDWGTLQANGRDIKHADCDGNGTIDSGDTLAIGLNYGLTHNSWRKPASHGEFPLIFDMPSVQILPGDTLKIPILLGNIDSIAVGIYGVAFSIKYDPTVLDSASGVKLSYENSWLGTKNVDMLTFDKDFYSMGQTDIALVRTNQTNRTGYGMVASIVIVISEDIAKKERPIELTFENVKAFRSNGDEFDLETRKGEAIVAIGTNNQPKENISVNCYPNPAGNMLYIEGVNNPIKGIRLMSLDGREVFAQEISPTLQTSLETRNLPSGLYFLEVSSGEAKITQKVLIRH